MSLAPGTRIGPHEVTALLGIGGMGEVYRARDTALGREVAIKVLPDAFANDADRLARFEREARTLAALNHPHIAHIYGLERSGGTSALVMELVEGPTLADRIAEGPLPVDEAMSVATQIADALESAHEHGIIHRDLKPANVKVRPDGVVKVLDFGLAKLAGRDGLGSGPDLGGVSQAATVKSPVLMTGAGMILGTAAYMAPEQARGRSVDKRADIWGFGCVLYEMLTGRRAFQGEDITETLAAVVRDQPDLSAIPAHVRTLVARCLEKDPKARLRDLGDRSLLLGTRTAEAILTKDGRRWVWPGSVAAALALAAIVVWAPWRQAVLPESISFEITPPPGTTLGALAGFALSPDGRLVAFNAVQPDGVRHVWIRSIASTSARMLPATADERRLQNATLVWSPDSRSLAFNQGPGIRRVDVASGEVRSVCDECGRVASWNADTLLTWAPGSRGIGQVSASSGSPTPASTPASTLDEVHHQHPAFLPDGRHFLFYGAGLDQSSGIYLGSLDEPAEQQESRRLLALKAPTTLGYAGGSGEAVGRILYMIDDKLFALPFDHERLMPTGEPVLVADGVGRGGAGVGYFAVSSAGALAYRRGNDERTLTWFDRAGAIIDSAGTVQADISLSPDGLWAAVASQRANGLELLDLRRGLRTRLTDRPGRNGVWSNDGARVAFSTDEDSTIWVRLSNGARPQEALLTGTPRTTPSDWSPDGRILLYSSEAKGTRYDIWALPLDGDRKPRVVVRTNFDDLRGQFSPDGRWIAYESSEPGGSRIHVTPFSRDAAEAAQRWTVASGIEPRWSPDGKQIFYRNGNERSVMAVDVSPGASFTVGTPKRLFPVDGPGPGNQSNAYFDVTPDGQRFLVNTFAPENLTAPITVVLNWRPDGPR